MGKASKRSWILKGEVVHAKGDWPYCENLRRDRNALINKWCHSQREGLRKPTNAKRQHIATLWKYVMRAGVSL